MSKSLNQAFIKAYSKEQAQLAKKREQGSNIGLNADDFIVRFDTATCVVPSMHSNPSRKPNAATAALNPEAAAPLKPPVSKQSAIHNSVRPLATERVSGTEVPVDKIRTSKTATKVSVETAVERQVAEELRLEIAARMSRAGAWEDQQIDAFIGGFPMISPYHQRTNPPQAGSTSARDQGLKGPHFGHRETRQAVLAANRDVAQSVERYAARSEPMDIDKTIPVRVAPLADNVAASPQSPASHSQRPTAQRNESRDPGPKLGSSAASSPALTPLEFPALSGGILGSQSAPAAQLSRAAHVQERGEAGDIFRLDRPTYSQPTDYQAVEHGSDSGELSSEVLEFSASGTHVDMDGLAANRADVSATAASRTKSRERDLRNAKVRIFNPVWEVDSFQWPDICLELLQQRAEVMELVARNLINACQEGLQVLAVTSPHSGEGRTTVACCLAKLAGSRGLNVAIVDGDIENPTLSYQTNLEVEQDWKTAILNQLPLEEVAVHSIDDQVTLVPLVAPIERAEMSTDDNRIELMLHELSESFDLVIVDMGHMDSSRSLVTSLGERGVISAVVAVVDYRTSTRLQVDDCLRRIRQTGVASIGLVENFAA